MRYRFLQDNDCHWYLIPEEQAQVFEQWSALTDDNDKEFRDYRFEDRRISGPVEAFTFTDPKEN